MGAQRKSATAKAERTETAGPEKVSAGLAAVDKLVASGRQRQEARRAAERDELDTIVRSLHTLERSGGVSVAALLDQLTQTVGSAPVADPSSLLTDDEEQALREAGSFVEEMPPFMARASTVTALQRVSIVATSLTTADVARILDVTEGRVRQRARDRALLTIRVGSALRFPAFQFPHNTEIPSWDRVAPAFPTNAHPVAIATFLGQPHVDLTVGGDAVSPIDWLGSGGEVQQVLELIDAAFKVRA